MKKASNTPPGFRFIGININIAEWRKFNAITSGKYGKRKASMIVNKLIQEYNQMNTNEVIEQILELDESEEINLDSNCENIDE